MIKRTKVFDIPCELAKEIAENLDLKYILTSYFVMRERNNILEIFCHAGGDIINADNISSYMHNKNDGWNYFLSDEVCVID